MHLISTIIAHDICTNSPLCNVYTSCGFNIDIKLGPVAVDPVCVCVCAKERKMGRLRQKERIGHLCIVRESKRKIDACARVRVRVRARAFLSPFIFHL